MQSNINKPAYLMGKVMGNLKAGEFGFMLSSGGIVLSVSSGGAAVPVTGAVVGYGKLVMVSSGTYAIKNFVVLMKSGGSNSSEGTGKGKEAGPTVEGKIGEEVGRFIGDEKGNIMVEPKGGSTVPAGKDGVDTHTTYPNGSNYQRYNPKGHPPKSTLPHGHGHLKGTGPGMKGQGPSIDVNGNVVPWNSPDAHWQIN